MGELTAHVRAVRALRQSGVFDERGYREQVEEGLRRGEDPVTHYVKEGAARGLRPHPLFDPAWYQRTVKGAGRSVLGPFVHYLRRGAERGDAPHPVFDVSRYLKQFPDAGKHNAGVLGHYLEIGWKRGAEINEWFDSLEYAERHPDYDRNEPAIVHFLRTANRRMDAVPDYRDFPRSYAHFDHAAATEFVQDVTGAWRARNADDSPPVVSIVIPTRDRADVLRDAIDSVIHQTYSHWELLIVDDGSTDGTDRVVASFTDRRIRYLRQEHSGVCRARNNAIDVASGAYLAYLDSDNRWESRFLEIMVAFLETTDHDAGYSALEMVDSEGATTYRGTPLNRQALLEQNYIDCNTLLHTRQLADEVGGWDESLRRTNDWDFLLRLSAATDVGYAPFIGVRYTHDRTRGDRITVREPVGYRFKVRAKHRMNWAEVAATGMQEGLTSIVIVTSGGPRRTEACIQSIERTTDELVEIIAVDNASRVIDAYRLLLLEDVCPRLRVIRPASIDFGLPLSANIGIGSARGDVIVLLEPYGVVEHGWLSPLVDPIRRGEAVATQPKVLDPAGVVVSTGYVFPDSGLPYDAHDGFAEHAPEVSYTADRSALNRTCLAASRGDLIKVEGLDPLFRSAFHDVDLCLRLAGLSPRPLSYVPESVVVRGPSPPARTPEMLHEDRHVFYEHWAGRLPVDEGDVLTSCGYAPLFYQYSDASGSSRFDTYRPVLERIEGRDRPLRWAIKIGPPDIAARQRWGDWHFALALRDALRMLGNEAVVDLSDAWYRPTANLDDVVLVLHGRGRYTPNPSQLNLIWLISHPDALSRSELLRYDRVFAASIKFAHKLTTQLGQPVEPLLQCTDPATFAPGPPSAPAHEVLFVGNSRGQLRPVVRDALAAGLPLAVYGAHWTKRLPADVIKDTHIDNAKLGVMYRSAGVVLNDHWEDMRREGFISNRLFDLAACGASVVTDPVAGLADIFGPTMRVYERPQDLEHVVHEALARREREQQERWSLAQEIREEHSFRARARLLDEIVRTLRNPIDSLTKV